MEALTMQRAEEQAGWKCAGADVAPIGASGEQNALVGDINAKHGVSVPCSAVSGDNAHVTQDRVFLCSGADKMPKADD